MLIGYARASLDEKSIGLQRELLEGIGCEQIYLDRCFSHKADRPGFTEALRAARPGDVFVIWRLDRIARSVSHLVELVAYFQGRGIALKVLADDVDTIGPEGQTARGIFAALAKLERDLVDDRATSTIAIERARRLRQGRGRPRAMSKQKIFLAIEMLVERKLEGKQVAAELGISLSTLYAYVDATGKPRERAKRLLAIAPPS